MLKRICIFFLIVVLVAVSIFSFGCTPKKPLTIVYLGDSIAEAIAGISLLSERENYGYYGVVGLRNEYIFKNRSVSGHMSHELLNLIKKEDVDIKATRSTIKSADIIHVSILGNDLLLADLGKIIISGTQDDHEFIDSIIQNSTKNFEDIVKTLRELNPKACLMFQKVYNPVFEDSRLINEEARIGLTEVNIHESEYREFCAGILQKLNEIIDNYLLANPGSYYIIDAFAEFDRIYKEDEERGKKLIFVDAIHPSIEGHAVIADLIQSKLEELKLANKTTALRNYKAIRKSQLDNLYKNSLDINYIGNQIEKATSCFEVTKIYFAAIEGISPEF